MFYKFAGLDSSEPHPITFYLQGDEMGCRPVDFDFYGSDSGSELIEGVFQDEGPLRRPEVSRLTRVSGFPCCESRDGDQMR